MAGYSGTPLAKKLGIKAGTTVHAIGAPANYRRLLEPLPESVRFSSRAGASTHLVHVFSTRSAELSKTLGKLRKTLPTGDTIRALALPLGFVDVKVCAVTEVWSALKLVVRKALR
jgi:hypothetical protein